MICRSFQQVSDHQGKCVAYTPVALEKIPSKSDSPLIGSCVVHHNKSLHIWSIKTQFPHEVLELETNGFTCVSLAIHVGDEGGEVHELHVLCDHVGGQ